MAHTRWMSLLLALGFAVALARAQSADVFAPCPATSNSDGSTGNSAVSRLHGDWHASAPTALSASTPPAMRDAVDLGLAPGSTRLDRLILVLQPSAAQQSALDAVLQSQQTHGSCEFHHWLTAQQFADRFANSDADVTAVEDWLRSKGFNVVALPASRGWIEFSGTAGQVAEAFGAPVHAFSTASGTRFAVSGPISVPGALIPVIHGLSSLDGHLAMPALTVAPGSATNSATALAGEMDRGRAEALIPKIAAKVMHLEGLPQGAGESIAIAARSNIRPADIAAFRSTFGLPPNPVFSVPSGPDPGLTADQAEAEFAASWAGSAAPAARIVVVPAGSTAATDGVDLSLAAIVDDSLANTVIVGFSACEASLSETHRAFYATLYRQAAAQGMSIIAATGDSGAAACHIAGSNSEVSTGYAVNALASTPWNTAVGAVAFASTGHSGFSAWSPANPAEPAYASGGGQSGTYGLPGWQPTIANGNGHRMLPDVTLPAALDSALSRGMAFCFSESASVTGCNVVRGGGTAAAAAIFGGISAVIAQTNGPQGNLAPRMYALRNREVVFTDVREGATLLACVAGSAGCDSSGTLGYVAAKGYDLATGLGVPDASNLLAAWPEAGTDTPSVTLTVSPTQSTYNPQATVTFTATITGGKGTPTGSINFENQTTGSNLNSIPYALDSSGAASVTFTGALPQGSNTIVALYGGDSTYAAQNSQVLTVNIQPSSTTTTVLPATTAPMVNAPFNVTATVSVGNPPAGAVMPTGNMTLAIDGVSSATGAVSTTGGEALATFTGVKVITPGSHNLQAIYAGDTNYSTSTSNVVAVNAASSGASVTLTVAPTQPNATYNPSATLTFTAGVASTTGGAAPTGTVNFLDQATGANLNTSPVSLTSGIATIKVSGGLVRGGNGIVAQYNGDSNYSATNSQVLTVNIQPSTTVTTVMPLTTTPAVGVAFPVTVTVAVATPPAGTTAPTGKVNLTLDGALFGSADVSTASGTTSASFNLTVPSGGGHNLEAVYAGDANYATSTSATVTVNAAKGATVTTLTAAPTSITAGTPETLTATIAAASSAGGTANTFTGMVTFYDGTSQIGTASVSGSTATLSSVTLSTTTTHSITAVYGGDGSWGGSTSNIVTLKAVLIPVTVTLTAAPATAGPGQVVTLLATVTPSTSPATNGEQNPTGKIIFYNGTTILGTVALSAAANNASTAQLLFTTLPAGQDTLTAAYLGDLYYSAATSNAVTIAVQDFALTPSPNNPPSDLDIVKGTSGQVSFTVTGLGGFKSAIALTCSVPAQDDMTCTPNPATVTPTGTVTFTVTTYLTGTASARVNRTPLWPGAAGGTALAALVFFLLPFGRRVRIFSERGRRSLILLLLLGAVGSAGVGCSSVSGSVQGSGTPLGETILTITGAANVDNTVFSHSINLTVNVLPSATGTSRPVKGAN